MTALSPTPSTRHRFHLLDALRAVASVVVVYWHARNFLPISWSHSGFLAVDFFFCLSGFVLAFSYERRLQSIVTLRQFVTTRLIRLYPTFLIGILLGFVLALRTSHVAGPVLLSSFAIQLFMLPSPVPRLGPPYLFPFDFPAWSILFELLANTAYAALIRGKHAGTQTLLVLIAVVAVASVVYVFAGHGLDAGPYWGRSIVCGLLRTTFSFSSGVVALRLFRRRSAPPWKPRLSLLTSVALIVGLLLLLIAPFSFQQNRSSEMLSIVLFPALIYVGALCRLPSALTSTCAFLGDVSYALYLLHAHVLTLLATPFALHTAQLHPASQYLFVPAVLLFTAGISFLLLKLYDAPVRAFLAHTALARRT